MAAISTIADTSVVVQGRVKHDAAGWQATWPGVSWALQFRGSAVGIKLTDAVNHYTLVLDGAVVQQILPQPKEQLVWLRKLAPGEHRIELIKRTESPHAAGRFSGFLLDDGQPLPSPAASSRRIEFIGDSFTAGLGNLSDRRECSEAEFLQHTDASRAFPMLTARALNAAWQINAMSGMGLVRNWNGQDAHLNFLTYYDRQLQTVPDSRSNTGWRPQVVVLGLGINDFSTPVQDREPRNSEQLAKAYVQSYRSLLTRLRQGNPSVTIIATAIQLYPDDRLRPLVRQIVADEQADGRALHYLEWQDLDLKGCVWHPSLADHARMTKQLQEKILSLPNIWE